MKKHLLVLLLVALTVILSNDYVSAHFEDEDDAAGVKFDKDYNVRYSGVTAEWKSGYRYSTDGFTVRTDHANADPRADGQFIEFIEIESGPNKTCKTTPIGSTETVSFVCSYPADTVLPLLHTLYEFSDGLSLGENLFFSPLFKVSNNQGQFVSNQRYYSLSEMLNSISPVQWSPTSQQYLPTLYDKPVPYNFPYNAFKVYVDKEVNSDFKVPNNYWENKTDQQKLDILKGIPGVLTVMVINPSDANKSEWYPSRFDTGTQAYAKMHETWGGTSQKPQYIGERSYVVNTFAKSRKMNEEGDNTASSFTNKVHSKIGGDAIFVMEFTKVPDEPDDEPTNIPSDFRCKAPSKIGERKSAPAGMQATPSGLIKADTRGAEKFDVSQGIPVTENLYTTLLGKEYLYEYTFGQYQGECEWTVVVAQPYNLTWTDSVQTGYVPCTPQTNGTCTGGYPTFTDYPRSAIDTVKKSYVVKRPYTYWAIDDLKIYDLKNGEVSNYALPTDPLVISPSGLQKLGAEASKLSRWDLHIDPPQVSNVSLPTIPVPGSTSRPSTPDPNLQSYAENAVGKVSVVNDSLKFRGATIMDNRKVEVSAPTPGDIPASQMIGNNVLHQSSLKIPATKDNGTFASTGKLNYGIAVDVNRNGSGKTITVPSINSVTIHTPVVNYSSVSNSNRPFDQSNVPDNSRPAVSLGRTTTINIDENGQHRNILGYGNNNYSKYTKLKRVQVPFDVFVGDTFYPANDWISVSIGQGTLNITVPTWVNEGNYTIRTEVYALNAKSGTPVCGTNANMNLSEYCATSSHPVKVTGRISGFKVYDIGDLRYEEVFRTQKGSSNWTGMMYHSGGRDKDGIATSAANKPQTVLPIRPGSHPTQAATAPHNGYVFKFYLDTIGNAWNVGEGVKITPRFYFVPKKGGVAPVEVDLYYDTTSAKLVKVGSSVDKKGLNRTIKMNDPYRNIASAQLDYLLGFEYDNFLTPAQRSAVSKSKYITDNRGRNISIGTGYDEVVLDYKTRTLIGKYDSAIPVSESTQKRGVQRWFGEYHIPIAPYIVAKGTNLEELARTKYKGKLDGTESEFMKGGYIIVNFDIHTYRNSQPNTAVNRYNSPNANMWAIEGQVRSSTSYLGAKFEYNYGDIIMFESDFSVRDDFRG